MQPEAPLSRNRERMMRQRILSELHAYTSSFILPWVLSTALHSTAMSSLPNRKVVVKQEKLREKIVRELLQIHICCLHGIGQFRTWDRFNVLNAPNGSTQRVLLERLQAMIAKPGLNCRPNEQIGYLLVPLEVLFYSLTFCLVSAILRVVGVPKGLSQPRPRLRRRWVPPKSESSTASPQGLSDVAACGRQETTRGSYMFRLVSQRRLCSLIATTGEDLTKPRPGVDLLPGRFQPSLPHAKVHHHVISVAKCGLDVGHPIGSHLEPSFWPGLLQSLKSRPRPRNEWQKEAWVERPWLGQVLSIDKGPNASEMLEANLLHEPTVANNRAFEPQSQTTSQQATSGTVRSQRYKTR